MSTTPVWGKVQPPPTCSLVDVMSEELITKMRSDDIKSFSPPVTTQFLPANVASLGASNESTSSTGATPAPTSVQTTSPTAFPAYMFADNPETQDDYALAQILQKQFDEEFDAELGRQESKENGNSKVSVSYSQLRRANNSLVPPTRSEENKDDEPEDNEEEEESDNDDDDDEDFFNQGPSFTFNRAGYSGKGANIKTKHDGEISEKKNAAKVVETFYPDFNTGDTSSIGGLRLSNRVYNELRVSAHQEQRRRARVREPGGADRATAERALDEKTRDIVFRLIQSDCLTEVTGVVSTGKEAVVLHARGGDGCRENSDIHFPANCAIKVFKTTLTEFRNRRMYMNGDFRFSGKHHSARKVVHQWAEKEMMNLKRMYKAGLPCPQPLFLRKNVLVMGFIGGSSSTEDRQDTKCRPAPQLKMCAVGGLDSREQLSTEQWTEAYQQTLQLMDTLHRECHLVHGDLSEYNLLWNHDRVWIIDVSQTVDLSHPHALEFLIRDCRNISTFFNKRGIDDVLDYEDHFNQLTGANIKGKGKNFIRNFAVYLSQLHDFENTEAKSPEDLDGAEDPFDLLFRRRQVENEDQEDTASSEEDDEATDEDDSDTAKVETSIPTTEKGGDQAKSLSINSVKTGSA